MTPLASITTRQVKGQGRGKFLGFPTINCVIPSTLTLTHGIYAVSVTIVGKTWKGAAHFGPVPTFEQPDPTLEVFLLDANDDDLAGLDTEKVTIEFMKRLRDVISFPTKEALIAQMTKDVAETRKILTY